MVQFGRGPSADNICMDDLGLHVVPVRRWLRSVVRVSVIFALLRRALTIPWHDVHLIQDQWAVPG